ncbi:MAG: hypothetical protein J3R72DRAFT_435897 [Linnemannia gamsii]|nr:MAG: hypothetical protein J3R72DRAFT_435897 [Linnemannia gamsii]
MSSFSALRRPRPLSLTGPRRSVSVNLSNPRVSENGVVLSAGQHGHVRWASLAHFDIECTSPPPPPPMSLEQVNKMRQMRQQQRQQQLQMQLESEQRLRQQQELQQTLAKDRATQMKEQQRQRPGSWSGAVTSFKPSPEVDEKHTLHQHQPPTQKHERSLSNSSVLSLSLPASASSSLLSKSRTGGRPKSMLTFRGNDQKMRFSVMARSTSNSQFPVDTTLESSLGALWDSIHQGLHTHQEE